MVSDRVVGEIIKGFSKKSVEIAREAVSCMETAVPALKVSYFVTDEDTRKYISDLDLDNPQKLAMFLVEAGFSTVEVVIDSVNNIQVDMMNDILSELEAIKEEIEHDLFSADANERLRNYQNDLIKLRKKLEGRVSTNIQRIIEIDNMNPFERRIKAAFIKKNVDLYTKSAQVCLKAVLEITKIHVFIADYIGDKNFASIQGGIDKFMNGFVFRNNHISLMNDWSVREDQAFWSDRIRKDYSKILEQQKELFGLFIDIRNVAVEQQIDLENIIFE